MARKSSRRILGMASNYRDLGRRYLDEARGKKESKKDKKIRKYMADGKISKKEAKKLQKRGISQSDVQRRYDKDFKRSQESFFTRPGRQRSPGATGPQYTPLMFSRGASKQFGSGYKSYKKSRDRDGGRSPEESSSSYDGYGDYEMDTSPYDMQIESLNDQIDSLTFGFQEQAAAMQKQMEADRAAAAERMAEMQGNFRQQMAAAVGQPRVEGIRFADYGTGGATRRQLARRGVGGTFGRGGERLMKISSLNV